MKVYEYYSRGKCTSCNDIIWNTHPSSSIQCICTVAKISPEEYLNTTVIGDIEFLERIKIELNDSSITKLKKL